MSEVLSQLIAQARKIEMSVFERRAQRKSFVYGNTYIENPLITREIVEVADAKLHDKESNTQPKK
ncbi:MAG: hypothetical protein U1E20_11640 [Methylocystis sp.]|uniref:hypothetical protein n=1 Tax=Methylocystis sp. TaxID=1911079 RepID=UPI0039394B4B